jgi:hypothetical protein
MLIADLPQWQATKPFRRVIGLIEAEKAGCKVAVAIVKLQSLNDQLF